jgi:hypothetical protein
MKNLKTFENYNNVGVIDLDSVNKVFRDKNFMDSITDIILNLPENMKKSFNFFKKTPLDADKLNRIMNKYNFIEKIKTLYNKGFTKIKDIYNRIMPKNEEFYLISPYVMIGFVIGYSIVTLIMGYKRGDTFLHSLGKIGMFICVYTVVMFGAEAAYTKWGVHDDDKKDTKGKTEMVIRDVKIKENEIKIQKDGVVGQYYLISDSTGAYRLVPVESDTTIKTDW